MSKENRHFELRTELRVTGKSLSKLNIPRNILKQCGKNEINMWLIYMVKSRH